MSSDFSIIIPVYNIAPYLRECLDSVLAQTFIDWEAICVDDGSTDGSGVILDEYAAKDNRFMVIHQENRGVSAARNAALAAARGEWFLFLDGDDVVRRDALETFVTYLKGCVAIDAILVHPYIPYWDGNDIPPKKVVTRILIENATKEDLFLGPYAANGLVISRVYRRRKFGHLRFRSDIAMAEDVCFWFDALCLDAKWMIVSTDYYLYRKRSDSACGVGDPHVCNQALKSALHALHNIDKIMIASSGAKLRYMLRFPYTVVYNMKLAITHCEELSCDEWKEIVGLVEEIENEVGQWPFSSWLKIKMRLAMERRWRWSLPLVMACETVHLLARRGYGCICRKVGSKLRRNYA